MFMDKLFDELNQSVTENGALGYKTSGKALLDLNFAVSSLRSATEQEILDKFKLAFYEDKKLALKWLFYLRDIRFGLGERRTFRIILRYLAENCKTFPSALLELIPEYGRFDDLFELFDTPSAQATYAFIGRQLKSDISAMQAKQPISLLAKWLPSINTSSPKTVKLAKTLAKQLGYSEPAYRKTLSALRKYLDVTECKMASSAWDKIDYSKVPSKANVIYKNAFIRHDEDRRREFLLALEQGETKINAGTLFPHDIVHRYMADLRPYSLTCDPTLEALWKALPNTVNACDNTIVVADGSGSMQASVGNSNVTALSVAYALAIYFSERSEGQFKNKYITFSSRPQLVDFSKSKTLKEKLLLALKHSEVSNTDIEAVFDLILKTAVKNNLPQEELPKNILIVSDMEFDSATTAPADTRLFTSVAASFKSHGYALPCLIFWNVCSRTCTIPVTENSLGVALVSGFSVNTAKMVLSGELDPCTCNAYFWLWCTYYTYFWLWRTCNAYFWLWCTYYTYNAYFWLWCTYYTYNAYFWLWRTYYTCFWLWYTYYTNFWFWSAYPHTNFWLWNDHSRT